MERTKWGSICAKRFGRQLSLDVEHCSPIALRAVILDVDTSAQVLDRIAQVYSDDEGILRDLVLCHNLDDTTLAFIALIGSEELRGRISGARVVDVVMDDAAKEADSGGKRKKLNVQQLVRTMTVPQKIKLALSGAKEARGLLVREASKMVATAVLDNPRITLGEVEFFAKSTNLSEDVIRKIGTNSEWTRKLTIISALVNNPKTPVGISLGFINRLTDHDLSLLEKSRNVPEAVRTAARNRLMKKKLGKG
jgi:hypothetical protein